ncbi:DUF1496 domain-containing protein [Ferrimonas balearica]|uniref:DUF1496 domain-containing protein n=1 Tax=Ferrimonas balearica TaxID=44012 RepID=UPI001C95D946|nr:DUF1496 domain-containing protein [Ferrimonas balearica]MBY6226068.1 YnjH family protein [Ferrimonas balearica]
MKIRVLMIGLLVTTGALAQVERPARVISTGLKPIPVVDGAEFVRACWYQGQQYSEGAPLEVGGKLLYCLPKNDYETNGALIWRSADAEPAPAKIRINP